MLYAAVLGFPKLRMWRLCSERGVFPPKSVGSPQFNALSEYEKVFFFLSLSAKGFHFFDAR